MNLIYPPFWRSPFSHSFLSLDGLASNSAEYFLKTGGTITQGIGHQDICHTGLRADFHKSGVDYSAALILNSKVQGAGVEPA